MIENIRKYTGLMTVVFVLLFIGLVYMDNGSGSSYGSGEPVVTANGTGFPEPAFRRLGESPVRVLQELSGASMQARFATLGFLYEMASSPDALPSQGGLDSKRFLVNRMNLREGAKEFGLHASDAEINEFLQEIIFVNQTGEFDQTAYETFVQKRLPRLGMGTKELYEILGEILVFQKLTDLLGTGISPSRAAVTAAVENNLQQVDYQIIEFKASTYEAKEEPTEEEIKTYWENNKGRYLSDPRRKLTYILAKPDLAAAREEKKKAEEEAKKAEAATNPDAEKPAILTREEQEDIVLDLGAEVDQLWVQIQESEGVDFDNIVKESKFETLTTELVSAKDLPGELRGRIQDDSQTGAETIFAQRFPSSSAMDTISDVIRIGVNWIIFRIDDAEEAQELAYEDAKEQARLDLVKERAHEAMAQAAEDAREKLTAALEQGTSFTDAAKELELVPVENKEIGQRKPALGEPTPQEVFNLVSKTNPGEVSDVLTQTNEQRSVFRSVIAYVDKREIIEDEQLTSTLEQGYRSEEEQMKRLAISNWLTQRYAAANVK